MSLFTEKEFPVANAISKLTFCNPFHQERIKFEEEALGKDFIERDFAWNKKVDLEGEHPNIEKLEMVTKQLVEKKRNRLINNEKFTEQELGIYEDLVVYFLHYKYYMKFDEFLPNTKKSKPKVNRMKIIFFKEFVNDCKFYFPSKSLFRSVDKIAHLFACLFLVRRAFHHIYNYIIGESIPAANLRASVWQSIFTHDMRRFRRILYDKMGEVTCLITGPSGTGKELVARAIGNSRYIPFDPQTESFKEDFTTSFYTLNLSALSPTLIESELFGHKKGAFTGALQDKQGWLEVCPQLGTIFLDEIGEIDLSIQVKLLRVLQNRIFQRLGDTSDEKFLGKIICATNKDLSKEIKEKRFREDFYYRLCSDVITTPSLHEQIKDSPETLFSLILHISNNFIGKEESEFLAKEAYEWIMKNLGSDYPWYGNVRELEQCVQNILIRKEYWHSEFRRDDESEKLAEEFLKGTLTAEDLLRRYCTLVYKQAGTYQETARRLKLDHRTIKNRIDPDYE